MKFKLQHLALPFFALAISANSFGQTKAERVGSFVPEHRTCGTMEHHEYLMKTRPNYAKDYEEYNKMINAQIENNAKKTGGNSTNTVITIPVVIHVVYNTATQNITDQQATSQLAVLNNDFQRKNADTVNTPAAFVPVAGGTTFQFCLAQRDPNGNPTTGIVHKASSVTSFGTNDVVKSTAQGGDDPWDVTKYMNIWICPIGGGILGYGEFPTGAISNTYGLVIDYAAAGTMGTANAPYNLGRTGTHEFGHCFNLIHIWGDNGQCGASDQCADTPPQKGGTANPAGCNYSCPTYPFQANTCTRPDGVAGASVTNTNGDMFMNYMDYTDDACMNIFTKNQCARMLAVVTSAPWNVLQSSNGCTPVILSALDAGVFSVTDPTGTTCNTSVTPKATLKNMGTTTLTSCTINYQIDAGTVNTFAWTGSLASLATTVVTLPAVTTTVGAHTMTVYTSNPNGGTDANATNDQSTSTFSVIAPVPVAMPFTEGFEGTTFVPAGWVLNNPDAADTWARTTTAHKTGVASATMDNFTNQHTGQIDEMMTPAIDLTSAASPQLTFQVAYQLYTSPTATQTFSDTLQVLISTDCGSTWTSIYKKFGAALTTTTPQFATPQFVPTANQWRMETVSLSPYASTNNAYIKFRNISDYEQNLYLDDINISGTVGIKEESLAPKVEVYPNPTQGTLSLNITTANFNETSIVNVYNMIGEAVTAPTTIKNTNGVYTLDLSSLSNGIYQLEVRTDKAKTVKKIVINK